MYFVKTLQYIPYLQSWDKLDKPHICGFLISVPFFSGTNAIMQAITAKVYRYIGNPVEFKILDIKRI